MTFINRFENFLLWFRSDTMIRKKIYNDLHHLNFSIGITSPRISTSLFFNFSDEKLSYNETLELRTTIKKPTFHLIDVIPRLTFHFSPFSSFTIFPDFSIPFPAIGSSPFPLLPWPDFLFFFWAADPKGTMSYTTMGEYPSIRPNEHASKCANARPVPPVPLPAGLRPYPCLFSRDPAGDEDLLFAILRPFQPQVRPPSKAFLAQIFRPYLGLFPPMLSHSNLRPT